MSTEQADSQQITPVDMNSEQEILTIEKEHLPRHLVIIPDGNRRWATERGLEPWEGHEEGAKNTEKLIREAHRLGVREISFWGSSLENLVKRPVLESKALLRIYETYFKRLLESDDIHKDEVVGLQHREDQALNLSPASRRSEPTPCLCVLIIGVRKTRGAFDMDDVNETPRILNGV